METKFNPYSTYFPGGKTNESMLILDELIRQSKGEDGQHFAPKQELTRSMKMSLLLRVPFPCRLFLHKKDMVNIFEKSDSCKQQHHCGTNFHSCAAGGGSASVQTP